MIDKEKLLQVIAQHLEGTDRFIVEVTVKAGNRIHVLMDADSGINIDHCVALTRHIESAFPREVEDYDLMVSSAGIDQPYRMLRQYVKNIGRQVEVQLTDATKIKGKLLKADPQGITLQRQVKVKGSAAVEENLEFSFDQIKQTKEIISFK
ncbi:MAG: ribosome assembly cofactor RimP [Lentimicrobiaceae bacterium]|nr:ribosome assembly cofactor RimP [Lentimicrobiaceae bacterium]